MAKTYLEIKKSDKIGDVRKKFKKLYPNLSLVFTKKETWVYVDKKDTEGCENYKVIGEVFKKMKEGKVDVSPKQTICSAMESLKKDLGIYGIFIHPYIMYDLDPRGQITYFGTDSNTLTFEKFNEKHKNEYYKITY